MFAYFDGDNIGNHLELLLMDNRIDDASEYSESVERALSHIRDSLEGNVNVVVIFAGGDDLVAKWPDGSVSRETIEKLRDAFQQICGRSISVGLGSSPSRAALNLRRAKLMGKSQVVGNAES